MSNSNRCDICGRRVEGESDLMTCRECGKEVCLHCVDLTGECDTCLDCIGEESAKDDI